MSPTLLSLQQASENTATFNTTAVIKSGILISYHLFFMHSGFTMAFVYHLCLSARAEVNHIIYLASALLDGNTHCYEQTAVCAA